MATDAATWLKNWQAGMTSGTAGQKYAAKIQATTKNPGALAAAQAQQYASACQAAVTSGRYATAMNGIDPAFWKSQVQKFGIQNWQNSAQKGLAKASRVANQMASAAAAAEQAVAAIPKVAGTLNLERVRAAAQAMKTAFGK